MKLLGILRGKRFSPNMLDKDTVIMQMVSDEIRREGHLVELADEDISEELLKGLANEKYDAVFTMLRSQAGIGLLRHFEKQGIPTVNSADGITNAGRANIISIMSDNRIPMPKTLLLSQNDHFQRDFLTQKLFTDFPLPCWVKKGEGWAQHADDVVFVQTQEQAANQIMRMHRRYPDESIVLTEHLKGDLVKFYGVEGTDFFFWRYPDPQNSKFGLEAINGSPARYKFDAMTLKQTCDKAAEASKIIVYGGDCVVDSNGNFRIIDFNDWPSFSACRNEASKAIAERILKTNALIEL